MKKLLLLIVIFTTNYINAQFLTIQESEALISVKNDLNSKKFEPYVKAKHGSQFDFDSFKKNDKVEYYKELWYYSKSFSVKRNHFTAGFSLDESIIDISRFEYKRDENKEVMVFLDGFCDVIILLPKSKLIFKND